MKLSRDDILKLAQLSRLRLSEEEISLFQKELSSILEYVEMLDSVDVQDFKPTYQVTGLTSADKNATREDVIIPQVPREELLKNVPHMDQDHIKVKRMII